MHISTWEMEAPRPANDVGEATTIAFAIWKETRSILADGAIIYWRTTTFSRKNSFLERKMDIILCHAIPNKSTS
ncbi:hypothetical protein RHMOL_Rhmol01G0382800 [Rhododendron molle]|uniref:Uncharacterized protein n=1 Tax=Rhododendron molle TaxID=49168 RepID=A0ACC0QCW1_RHOML|nr:hypothetical protein RHMOL_Rhmol01G0382800 [Rhododendron molle]